MYVALINRFNLSVFHAKNYTDIKENNLLILYKIKKLISLYPQPYLYKKVLKWKCKTVALVTMF